MTTNDQPGIRVEIEIMAGYQPPTRVAAALAELSDALAEAGDVDVEGYASYLKIDAKTSDPLRSYEPLQNLSKSLTNNEVIDGIWKF
jgi:hypothetical protein